MLVDVQSSPCHLDCLQAYRDSSRYRLACYRMCDSPTVPAPWWRRILSWLRVIR